MRNKDLRTVVDSFKFFYISVTKKENYIFKMTENKKKVVLNFIGTFLSHYNTELVQKDILNEYMTFQFNYWYKQDAKYGQGVSIQLEWIIGSKAWERWLNLETNLNQKIKSKIQIKKGLKRDIDFKIIQNRNVGMLDYLIEVNEIEEHEKGMFFNTSKGFQNCTNNTSLYNHKSKFCISCKFKQKCKENLKEIYKHIYKKRGY